MKINKERNTHSDARNPAMLPRARSRREISQVLQRSPQSASRDFLY